MKKYKVKWSWTNIFAASSEKVVQLQMIWAGFSTAITGSTFVMSNDRYALIAAIGCMLVDKILIGCLHVEEVPA